MKAYQNFVLAALAERDAIDPYQQIPMPAD
jgi:hypothetical protein